MNFDDVIAAHAKWKNRLRECIEGKGDKLDPNQVRVDHACGLGQWMYGEGAKHAAEPAFAQAKAEHQRFHLCAAEVVAACQRGDKAGAEKLVGFGSAFAGSSAKLVKDIAALRSRVEKK